MLKKRRVVLIEAKAPRPHVYSRVKLPRLGAVLLGTILRNAGYEVVVYIEEIQEIDWSEALEADIIGISTLSSTSPRAYQLADKFREAGKTVIMGGAHPTFCAKECLEHCDYVLRGESELSVVLLAEAICAGREPGLIPGISYYGKDGNYVSAPIAPFVNDLDQYPIPDFSLVRGQEITRHVVSISTSRGCPYSCKFCSVIITFGRKFRYHSVERVIEEVKQNASKTNHIFFCDDIFNANVKRTKEILRRMKEEKITTDWSAQMRVEATEDEELLELMAATKCFGVYVGFESVNERTLKEYNKHQDLNKITKSIDKFHQYGVHVHGMFVLGSDEDDVETIQKTATYCRQMKVDSVQFMILTPLPGTPTYEELDQAGRIFQRDWSYYDGASVVFEPKKMTAYELESETFKALDKFYKWSDVLRYALKKDKYYALIRLYAKILVKKGKRVEKPYIEKLKRMATQNVLLDQDKETNKKKLKSIGVIMDWLDEQSQTILIKFLRALGMNPILAHMAADSPGSDKVEGVVGVSADKGFPQKRTPGLVANTVSSIKDRVDCLLVPVNSKFKNQIEALNQKGSSIKQWVRQKLGVHHKICITPEIHTDEIYKACVQIGLALDRRISVIRRAYQEAINTIPPTMSNPSNAGV